MHGHMRVFSTYNVARGLFQGRRSGLLSTSHMELSARGPFPFLGASASRVVEAALFFGPHGTQHGAPSLYVLSVHHLGLHVEGFEPQPEVGVDAEEGLAHDNEHQDIEEGVRGKIVKIDPIVIHDSPNERVKGKPEPTDIMGKEHDSLMRFRSGDDLSRRWKTVADLLGQIPCLPELLDVLLLDS